jgi:hypothetical protein
MQFITQEVSRAACDPSRLYRVTIEEQVSECCEKWRGRSAFVVGVGYQHPAHKVLASFCPECGRKL